MTKNWGRWGDADERGALNLIDEAACRRGLASVAVGRSITLGLPVGLSGPSAAFRAPVQHYFTRHGGDYAAGVPERPGYGYADDVIVLPVHGTTHLDSLAHVWRDHTMWNGYSASTVTSRGASKAGIDKAGPIVTRGLFVDAAADGSTRPRPGEVITREIIERRLAEAGVAPSPGDALIVRSGWLDDWRANRSDPQAWQGLGVDIVDWVDRHDIAIVGVDNISVEAQPSTDPGCALPLHIELLRNRGVALLELLDLEALASAGATTFMLTIAPLNIVGGSGSPVAPVATF